MGLDTMQTTGLNGFRHITSQVKTFTSCKYMCTYYNYFTIEFYNNIALSGCSCTQTTAFLVAHVK